MEQAGKTNRYRIIARLCSGGMADIFLAVQVDQQVMDRLVVIKKVHSTGEVDEETSAMFIDEARIISTLNHPHVIQIFDFSEENGSFVLVMEYIDGMSLAELDVPDGVLVLTVVRGEDVLLARGKTRLQQGDLLLLLVENEHEFARMKSLLNRG